MLKKTFRFILYFFIGVISLFIIASTLLYVFKDKIIALTINEINKNLAARVEVSPEIGLSIIDKFPNVSLEFKNIVIYEAIPGSKKKLGNASRIYLVFKPYDFIQGNYVIEKLFVEKGSFHLISYQDGMVNYNVIKTDTTRKSASSVNFKLDLIRLDSVLVIYEDQRKSQLYSVLGKLVDAKFAVENQVYKIGLDGKLLVHSIEASGDDYFREKEIVLQSNQVYTTAENKYEILPSLLIVDNSSFTLKGLYNWKGSKEYIDIEVQEKGGNIQTLLSLMPSALQKDFSAYRSKGDVFFNGSVKGYFDEKTNPELKFNFGFKNCSFFHPDMKQQITNASLAGSFTNGSGKKSSTSVLQLKNISFNLRGQQIKGNLRISNFIHPFIQADAQGSVDLAAIKDFYPLPDVKKLEGSLAFDLTFEGNSEDLKSKEGINKIKTSGQLIFEKVNLEHTSIPYPLRNWRGTLLFNNNDIALNGVQGNIGRSDVEISGIMKNLLSRLTYDKAFLVIEADLKSGTLDLNELLKKLPENNNENVKQVKLQPGQSAPSSLADQKRIRLSLACHIGNLYYEKLNLKNLKGEFVLTYPEYLIRDVTMNYAGGKIKVDSRAVWKDKNTLKTNSNISFTRLNIDTIFYSFNNFDQEFIQEKNLSGKISGTLKMMCYFNQDFQPDLNSLVADADISIRDGQLINFEPMQKMSRFIDEKELEQVKFSELKNRILIENKVITIPEMQIKSNVSDISIIGTHTFDNYMDYRLTVPLKNFKKERIDKDERFGELQKDKRGNTLIFLTIKGPADDFKIAYDTKSTKQKIKDDLKKEQRDFEDIFKKRNQDPENTIYVTPSTEEFFEFD